MRKEAVLMVGLVLACLLSVGDGAEVFSDNFDGGPSPLWGNERGNWTSIGGGYASQNPDNIPPTFSSLPFLLRDFAIELDLYDVSDGGVWLRSDFEGANATGVLLVTGGWQRTGTGFYWHTVHDDRYSAALNENNGLFAQGDDIHLRVEVSGDTYWAYLNGVTEAATTLTTGDFVAGYVGMYDYSGQRFDNIVVSSERAWPDLLLDGIVNLVDFSLFANDWLASSCDSEGVWCESRDMDYNSIVDIVDLMILADEWLTFTAP